MFQIIFCLEVTCWLRYVAPKSSAATQPARYLFFHYSNLTKKRLSPLLGDSRPVLRGAASLLTRYLNSTLQVRIIVNGQMRSAVEILDGYRSGLFAVNILDAIFQCLLRGYQNLSAFFHDIGVSCQRSDNTTNELR